MKNYELHFSDSSRTNLKSKSVDLIIFDPPFWNHLNYSKHKAQIGNTRNYKIFLTKLERIIKESVRILNDDRFFIATPPDFYETKANKIKNLHNYSRDVISVIEKNNLVLINEVIVDFTDTKYRNFIPKDHNSLAGRKDLLPMRYRRMLVFAKKPSSKVNSNPELIKLYWQPIIKFSSGNKLIGSSKAYKIATKMLSNEKLRNIALKHKLIKTKTRSKEQRAFPASMNISFCKYLIKSFSDNNQLVFDPFTGSGTTLDACLELGRSFIGYEINEDMEKIITSRINKANFNYNQN